MAYINGIDVSEWQGSIDWHAVKDSGIKFAMIRLGYGSADGRSCGLDVNFYSNTVGAIDAGLDVGTYFYSYARSPEAAKHEADFVIEKLRPLSGKLTYPIAYDLEDTGLENLGRDTLTDMAVAFCERIEQAGYYASYYSNLNWRINFLIGERLSRFDFWLAQWSDSPTDSVPFGMWQKSSRGNVPGISGNVDLDEAYIDYPAIIRREGLNGFEKGVIHLDITIDRLKEIIRETISEEDPIYKKLDDVPEYWKEPAKKLLDSGSVNGGDETETDILNLRRETLKAAVIAVRYSDSKS